MATFKLTRCKFRDGWLVPKKGELQVEVDWNGLVSILAPSKSYDALKTLRVGVAPNAYVGLVRQPTGAVTNFAIRNVDLSGDVRVISKRDPTFQTRLVDAYRVDYAQWDASVQETAQAR